MNTNERGSVLQQNNRYSVLMPVIYQQYSKRPSHNFTTIETQSKQQSNIKPREQTISPTNLNSNQKSDDQSNYSSSKLSSSNQMKSEKKTSSPLKLQKILSLSNEDERPNKSSMGELLWEISNIEMENDRPNSKTISLKNIRIQKQQLSIYLMRFYPEQMVENIVRSLKVPTVMNFNQYQTWITKIEELDLKQCIKLAFLIYDLNNEGEIITNNLLSLLKTQNKAIEMDILYMVKQIRLQLQQQRTSERITPIQQPRHQVTLPASILRCKLDQSVVLHHQRRQSIRRTSMVDSPRFRGRSSIFKLSRGSIDLSIDNENTIQQQQFLNIANSYFAKRQVITLLAQTPEDDYVLQQKKKKKIIFANKQNRINIDLNGFFSIWYPNKPNLIYDVIRKLVQKQS